MMTPNPAIPSRSARVDYSIDAQVRGDIARPEGTGREKWPVWARLVIIVGGSAMLWAGIISGTMALFG